MVTCVIIIIRLFKLLYPSRAASNSSSVAAVSFAELDKPIYKVIRTKACPILFFFKSMLFNWHLYYYRYWMCTIRNGSQDLRRGPWCCCLTRCRSLIQLKTQLNSAGACWFEIYYRWISCMPRLFHFCVKLCIKTKVKCE